MNKHFNSIFSFKEYFYIDIDTLWNLRIRKIVIWYHIYIQKQGTKMKHIDLTNLIIILWNSPSLYLIILSFKVYKVL